MRSCILPLLLVVFGCVSLAVSASASAAEAEKGASEQGGPDARTETLSVQDKVEAEHLRYMKVDDEGYSRGYLSVAGVFYRFRGEEPLKADELPSDKEERRWRLVAGAKDVVEIDRPGAFTLVEMEDGRVALAHVLQESKTVLVFVGSMAVGLKDFASLRGPISGLRVDTITSLGDSGYVIAEIAGRPHRDERSGDSGEPAE